MSPLPDRIESESLGGGWGGVEVWASAFLETLHMRSTDLGLNGDSDPRTMNDHTVRVLDDAIADLSPAGSSRGK